MKWSGQIQEFDWDDQAWCEVGYRPAVDCLSQWATLFQRLANDGQGKRLRLVYEVQAAPPLFADGPKEVAP